MSGQVALTTVLLVGALLYLRSYAARIGLDKGFDSSNLATIVVSRAPDAPGTAEGVESEILTRLRATPGVRSIARTSSLPPSTQSGVGGSLTIEGREATQESVMMHFDSVDPEYFSTMNIQVLQGRPFDASTAADQVVIDERFAKAYWPNGAALGARRARSRSERGDDAEGRDAARHDHPLSLVRRPQVRTQFRVYVEVSARRRRRSASTSTSSGLSSTLPNAACLESRSRAK
jgi:hypothetical protein